MTTFQYVPADQTETLTFEPACIFVQIIGKDSGISCKIPTHWTVSAMQHHVRELQEWWGDSTQ